MWGPVIASIWVEIRTMKKAKIYYTLASEGLRSIILHTTANQKQVDAVDESRERRPDHRATFLVTIRGGVL